MPHLVQYHTACQKNDPTGARDILPAQQRSCVNIGTLRYFVNHALCLGPAVLGLINAVGGQGDGLANFWNHVVGQFIVLTLTKASAFFGFFVAWFALPFAAGEVEIQACLFEAFASGPIHDVTSRSCSGAMLMPISSVASRTITILSDPLYSTCPAGRLYMPSM